MPSAPAYSCSRCCCRRSSTRGSGCCTRCTLIYVAVIVLGRRGSPSGYGAGCAIALLSNYTNLFATTFIAAGLRELARLATTRHLERPDLLVAVVAAAGHVLLIVACAGGFLTRRPGLSEWGKFVAGGALAVGYFVAIILLTGPLYVPLLRKMFGAGG